MSGNMSLATSSLNTTACLRAADDILGHNRVWTPQSDEQAKWLQYVYAPGVKDLSRVTEIKAKASRTAEEHIAFLKQHGWEAQITACPPDGFLTAAVLDILVEWLREGTFELINVKDKGTFPATKLVDGTYQAFNEQENLIVCTITTKSGDTVHIGEAPRAPGSVQDLTQIASSLFDGQHERVHPNNGILVPMIDLSSKQSLDFLVGLSTTGEDKRGFFVAQALQQATLKLNNKGARARAADEMMTRSLSMPKPPLRIERPFILSIRRPGVAVPVFTAYCDYGSWKDPGKL